MNYEAVWKLMADVAAELKDIGEPVPPHVMRDLRSAKTMIEIFKLDRSHYENLLRIEEYLANLESYLLSATKRRLGEECAIDWAMKIDEAKRAVQVCEKEPSTGFPLGVPRDKHWVRIEPSEEMPVEKIRQLSEQIGLTCKTQRDGYVLVYGGEDEVKKFVKKAAELIHQTEPH